MAAQRTPDLSCLIDYFNGSRFEYLALEYAGAALRLQREPASSIALLAPAAGTIELPPQRPRMQTGQPVRRGECLFVIRRFKSAIEVPASLDGRLTEISVEPGTFVEYGQALARLESP